MNESKFSLRHNETSNWHNSLKLLQESNYTQGWLDHDQIRTGQAEYRNKFQLTPTYNKKIWQGETDVSLLVNADFGMGDTIHFWRFIPLVKDRVSRLTIRCDEDFGTLFKDTVDKTTIPDSEYIIHMMALPKILNNKISGKPYLIPNPPKNDFSFFDKVKFTKIGFCWQGNPFNPRDSIRSIRSNIKAVLPDRVKLFCLNKIGEVPEGFFNMKAYMEDWNETANLLKYMDLVISVDTAVAHLAGAMGVPTWLLLGKDIDWRWQVDKETTIWYDSMRIFHVKTTWEDLLKEVKNEL